MIEIIRVSPEIVWPVRHQVMYPELTFEEIKLESDIEGYHLALFEDGKVISVVSLVMEGEELQFRKFATVENYQGKGYGSKMLAHIIEFAVSSKFERVWCNARRSATGFYSKFGFKETDESFFKDGHDFVIMELRISSDL